MKREPSPLYGPLDITFDHYDPAEEPTRESRFGLGNGILFARAAAPEALTRPDASAENSTARFHYPGLYLEGVYNRVTRCIDGKPTGNTALASPILLAFLFRLRLDSGSDRTTPTSCPTATRSISMQVLHDERSRCVWQTAHAYW